MANKVKQCCSCGETFIQRRKCQRMCLGCRHAQSIEQANKAVRRRRGNLSRLDANIKAADAAGMSYGKYKASQYVQAWTMRGKVK